MLQQESKKLSWYSILFYSILFLFGKTIFVETLLWVGLDDNYSYVLRNLQNFEKFSLLGF